jgi:membrane associated rhomboid family serine protease
MLYLFIFGDNVEDRLGHLRYLLFYLLCGTAATFAQYMFNLGSDVPNLGASGAIAGVLGAYLIMFPGERVRVLMGYAIVQMSALVVIGFWIILQVLSSLTTFTTSSQTGGGVAYMAHIGGFAAGIVLTFLFGARTDPRLRVGY